MLIIFFMSPKQGSSFSTPFESPCKKPLLRLGSSSSTLGGSRRARDRKFNKRRVQFEQQKKLKEELYDCRVEEEEEKLHEQEKQQVNTLLSTFILLGKF